MRPPVDLAQADDRLDQLVLAVARDAGDPEDLAGPDLEVDAADGLDCRGRRPTSRPVTVSAGSPGCDSPRSTISSTSRPTISSARSSSFVSDGIRWPTTLPRRMTVIRSAISRTS